MVLMATNREQPVRMSDVFGAPRNTPVNNPWLSGYWDNYAAREKAFQNQPGTYQTYGQAPVEEPQTNLQSALNANKDVYRPRPAQSDGGDDFGATRQVPYNPEAILALDQSKWAKLGLLGLPGGGFISAMNSAQAQNIRDDEMYSFLNDPSNRAAYEMNILDRGGNPYWGGPANLTDLGKDRSVADNLGAPYSTDQLGAEMAMLNDPDNPFSVAAFDPSSFAPPGYDFEDPYGGLLGFGDLPGVLGDMYSGAKRGVTDFTNSVLGLFADPDALKGASPNPSLMTDEAYAAAYGRANPRAGFSPATLAALAKQDAWTEKYGNEFGITPGSAEDMGVYGASGYAGRASEVGTMFDWNDYLSGGDGYGNRGPDTQAAQAADELGGRYRLSDLQALVLGIGGADYGQDDGGMSAGGDNEPDHSGAGWE